MAMADSSDFVTVGPDATSLGGGTDIGGCYDVGIGTMVMIVDGRWLEMVAAMVVIRRRTFGDGGGAAVPGTAACCRAQASRLPLARRRTLANPKRYVKSRLITLASSANRAGAAVRFGPSGLPVQS